MHFSDTDISLSLSLSLSLSPITMGVAATKPVSPEIAYVVATLKTLGITIHTRKPVETCKCGNEVIARCGQCMLAAENGCQAITCEICTENHGVDIGHLSTLTSKQICMARNAFHELVRLCDDEDMIKMFVDLANKLGMVCADSRKREAERLERIRYEQCKIVHRQRETSFEHVQPVMTQVLQKPPDEARLPPCFNCKKAGEDCYH